MADSEGKGDKKTGAEEKGEKKPRSFIKTAIKRPGALTAKAKAAGMSVPEYARAHARDSGQAGEESRLYLNVLSKVAPGGRKA